MSENPNDYNLPDDYFFVTQSWGSRFYKVYSDRYIEYNAAKTKCESDGAFLAIPRSEAENDYIADLIPNANIWIGINDIDQEGEFVAVDGSDITYKNWDSGEPNNENKTEDAVVIRTWTDTGAWNDYDEKKQARFVCSFRIQGMFIKVSQDHMLKCQQNSSSKLAQIYTRFAPYDKKDNFSKISRHACFELLF